MINPITWTYHRMFKDEWFFITLRKNVRYIADKPNLTNEQKGDQIYYHVFWQTWRICNEPYISWDLNRILNAAGFMISTLHKLGWHEPKHTKKLENEYQDSLQGFGLGLVVSQLDFNLSLWHFGTAPNFDYCWRKAFAYN